jgi:hypothetical protein
VVRVGKLAVPQTPCLSPPAVPLPERGRAPTDRATPVPHASALDVLAAHTPHPLVQDASSAALDDVLFRLLVGSDEWPTAAMAFHDKVDLRHSFQCVRKTSAAGPAPVLRPPSQDTGVWAQRPEATRTISRYARKVDVGLLAESCGSLTSTELRSGENAATDAVPSLVLLLCSKDREAPAVLSEVTACSPTKTAAVDSNAVVPLVRLLASNDVIVLRNACRALKNITETLDDARAAALNADAIPALIPVISRHRLGVQEEAMGALRAIIRYPSTQASTIDVSDAGRASAVSLPQCGLRLTSAVVCTLANSLDIGSYGSKAA